MHAAAAQCHVEPAQAKPAHARMHACMDERSPSPERALGINRVVKHAADLFDRDALVGLQVARRAARGACMGCVHVLQNLSYDWNMEYVRPSHGAAWSALSAACECRCTHAHLLRACVPAARACTPPARACTPAACRCIARRPRVSAAPLTTRRHRRRALSV